MTALKAGENRDVAPKFAPATPHKARLQLDVRDAAEQHRSELERRKRATRNYLKKIGISMQKLQAMINDDRDVIEMLKTRQDRPPHRDTVKFLEEVIKVIIRVDPNLEAECRSFIGQWPAPQGKLPDEQIIASVVLGHLATFTQSAPAALRSANRLTVFQTGGPKAPTWWRQMLRAHLIEAKEAGAPVEYNVILCIDPEMISRSLLHTMEAAGTDFEGAGVDLWIYEERPQLGIDILIVDEVHVFLGLHSDTLESRQCSIYVEDSRIADAISCWLAALGPLTPYETWRRIAIQRLDRCAD